MARVQQIQNKKSILNKQLASRPARKSAPASGGLKRPIRMSPSGLSFMLDAAIAAKDGWIDAFKESLNVEMVNVLTIHEKLPIDCAETIIAYEGTQCKIRQKIDLMIQRYTMQIKQLNHIISAESRTAHPPQQLFPNHYRYKNTLISVVYDGSVTKDDRLSLLF